MKMGCIVYLPKRTRRLSVCRLQRMESISRTGLERLARA
jgi:hypothetical protein